MTRHRASRIPRPTWLLPVLVTGLFGMSSVAWYHGDRSAPSSDIVVVRAPPTVLQAVPLIRASHAAPDTVTAEAAAAHVRDAYPLLSDVVMECRADRCTLTATILPLTTQADLDRRQEMLLGGLGAALAADGYRMDVPFRMQEVDDNLFHLRASVIRERPA